MEYQLSCACFIHFGCSMFNFFDTFITKRKVHMQVIYNTDFLYNTSAKNYMIFKIQQSHQIEYDCMCDSIYYTMSISELPYLFTKDEMVHERLNDDTVASQSSVGGKYSIYLFDWQLLRNFYLLTGTAYSM